MKSLVSILLREALLLEPRDQFLDGLISFDEQQLIELLQLLASLVHDLLVELVLLLAVLLLKRFLSVEDAELLEVLRTSLASTQS